MAYHHGPTFATHADVKAMIDTAMISKEWHDTVLGNPLLTARVHNTINSYLQTSGRKFIKDTAEAAGRKAAEKYVQNSLAVNKVIQDARDAVTAHVVPHVNTVIKSIVGDPQHLVIYKQHLDALEDKAMSVVKAETAEITQLKSDVRELKSDVNGLRNHAALHDVVMTVGSVLVVGIIAFLGSKS